MAFFSTYTFVLLLTFKQSNIGEKDRRFCTVIFILWNDFPLLFSSVKKYYHTGVINFKQHQIIDENKVSIALKFKLFRNECGFKYI